ncbi:M48 family metalloprotease [Streptomyces sp. NPDC014870]|uniref:M48 family metalloprotease n=1 Tax=Streptomyces sp. NPDC014870 TaxID=3364925 RepID=UPI0036F4E711
MPPQQAAPYAQYGQYGQPAQGFAPQQPVGQQPAPPAPAQQPYLAEGYAGQTPPSQAPAPAPVPVPTQGYPPVQAPTGPPPPAYTPGPDVHVQPVQRRADATALTTLLLMLPNFLGSLLVVWAVSALMPTGVDVAFIIVWLASGAFVFYRPAERLFAKTLLRWREPTGAELAALRPLWDEVMARANIKNPAAYELWIEDKEEINAAAAAGHMVGVTRWSLHHLPPERLTAVLAHELGHHVGGHAWAGLLGLWYALPGRVARRVAGWVLRVVAVVAQVVPLLGCLVGLVFVGLVIAVAVTFPPVLIVFVTPYLLAWAGRAAELRADRTAAELGYGPLLHAVLSGWQAFDAERAEEKLLERLMATHPPMHQRIRELEKFADAAR